MYWWSHFFLNPGWEAVGLLGQCAFGSRFLYQWFVSEKAGRSIIPSGFWWLSIFGSILIMIYAFHKGSLTFTIPTLIGVPVYIRNLILLRKEKR